jgi:hypothetical protein
MLTQMSLLQSQFRASLIQASPRFLIARSAHTNARRLTLPHIGRKGLVSGAATVTLLGGSLLMASDVTDLDATTLQDGNHPASRKLPSLTSMFRSYAVYTMCCIPALVDWSPKILGTLMSIPVVRDITESIVRATFFAQVNNHHILSNGRLTLWFVPCM